MTAHSIPPITTTRIETTRIEGRRFSVPRWLNIILGGWLLASAFVWPQTDAVRANHVIVGMLIATIAFYAIFVPAARRLNTVLAAWLLASTVVLDHVSPLTIWNGVAVAIVVFIASLPRSAPPSRIAHA